MRPIDTGNDFLTGRVEDIYMPEESEFIKLSGGLEYIRKFEVVGLRWAQYITDENELAWCLKVFFNEAPSSTFYGENARSIMKAFHLPPEPPGM